MSAAVPASLTLQLLTVSIVTLQRQIAHNRLANRNEWNSEYDFVVVGAGSAGCVVAARLSENPNFRVILIEAGGADAVLTDMPGAEFSIIGSPDVDWNYVTTPQTRSALAYSNPVIRQPRGRVMGGTSSMNGMAYMRGNARGYDGWANNYGAKGWSYKEVLPYFIRSENNTDPAVVRANPGHHGTGGPLAVTTAVDPDPILVRLRDALVQLGYPLVDLNGPSPVGTNLHQETINTNAVRASTANNFLQPVFERRPNLHIISRSLVTRIMTRRTADNRLEAYGVSFSRDGREYSVSARHEVIVSAGVFATPQLLMLSGIGPADHLRQFGIPVVADLPVGDNLMDHVIVGLNFIVNNATDVTANPALSVNSLYQYYEYGSGPLSRLPELFTYYSSTLNEDREWPEGIISIAVVPTSSDVNDWTAGFIAARIPEWNAYYVRFAANNTLIVSIGSIIVRPQSRGTVRLASRDPTAAPLIDMNFYGNPRDLAVHVGLIGRLLEITDSRKFRRLVTGSSLPIPGCQPCGPNVALYNCYSYVVCVAQSLSASYYHPSSSCRMGSASDSRAVVDEKLRVRGVSRLRVMDASVFPEIPNANTNAATIMVAERGSEFLRQDYS